MLASSHVTKCTYMYMYCAVWAFCSLRTTELKADLQIQKCLIKRDTQSPPISLPLQLFSCTCMHLQVYHMAIYGNDDMFYLCSLIFMSTYTCMHLPSCLCKKTCVHSDLPHRFVSMQRMMCTVYVLLVVFDACVPTQICAVGIMSYI